MKIKYLALVACVGAVAAGLYFMSNRTEAPSGAHSDTGATSGAVVLKRSLREFLAPGTGGLTCTFGTVDGTTHTTGVSYIADGKVRTDSTITMEGAEPMTSYSIIDAKTMYAWGSAMPGGMKTSIAAIDVVKEDAAVGGDTKGMDRHAAAFDTAYDYSCTSWNVDASFFVPPTDVTFTDYSDMMKGMQEMMSTVGGTDAGMVDGEMMDAAPDEMMGMPSKAMLCAACDRTPDSESQTQCREVLGCE